jgi:hypothetical protein
MNANKREHDTYSRQIFEAARVSSTLDDCPLTASELAILGALHGPQRVPETVVAERRRKTVAQIREIETRAVEKLTRGPYWES